MSGIRSHVPEKSSGSIGRPSYLAEELKGMDAKKEEEGWTVASRLLDAIVMVDVKKVVSRHQRKALVVYFTLVALYVVAMGFMTYSLFESRRHPVTRISIVKDPHWTNQQPNIIVCHWTQPHPYPDWRVASYQVLDRETTKWSWDPEWIDRVTPMGCPGYKACIFVKGGLEGPEEMKGFPSGRWLDIKVGYILPNVNNDTADMGLSVWFTDSPSAEDTCAGGPGDFSFVRGFTPAVAHLMNHPDDKEGELSTNSLFPYDLMMLHRTKNVTLEVQHSNLLTVTSRTGLTYQVTTTPNLNISMEGLEWYWPLNSTRCSGKDDYQCFEKEAGERNRDLKMAGRNAIYFHFQLWAVEAMTVIQAKDPVEVGVLLGSWGGSWGFVSLVFGLFFWGNITKEATPCLRFKWWRRQLSRLRSGRGGTGTDRDSSDSSNASNTSEDLMMRE